MVCNLTTKNASLLDFQQPAGSHPHLSRFPIPNRRFSKRAYRVSAKTLICWGNQDRLIPPVYAEAWQRLIAGSEIARIDQAGHMLTVEQPRALADAIAKFAG